MAGKGGGSQSVLPGPGGKARQKYLCDVCHTAIISYDVKNHYQVKNELGAVEKTSDGSGGK